MREKEQCPVLLSCLSVAGGEEQRKLVGCGISHVCLTLPDSLLCYSLTHSLHSLQEMCDSPPPALIFLPQSPHPHQPKLFTSSRSKLPPQRQVGFRAGGKQDEMNGGGGGGGPSGREVTGSPVHPTPVPWRQGGVDREGRGGSVTHLSPGEVAIGGMRTELKREEGKTAEKHTCPLTFRGDWKRDVSLGGRMQVVNHKTDASWETPGTSMFKPLVIFLRAGEYNPYTDRLADTAKVTQTVTR